jgi:hypothetical protein
VAAENFLHLNYVNGLVLIANLSGRLLAHYLAAKNVGCS